MREKGVENRKRENRGMFRREDLTMQNKPKKRGPWRKRERTHGKGRKIASLGKYGCRILHVQTQRCGS